MYIRYGNSCFTLPVPSIPTITKGSASDSKTVDACQSWVRAPSKDPVVFLSKKLYPHSLLLVGSRNGLECDLHKKNSLFHNRTKYISIKWLIIDIAVLSRMNTSLLYIYITLSLPHSCNVRLIDLLRSFFNADAFERNIYISVGNPLIYSRTEFCI